MSIVAFRAGLIPMLLCSSSAFAQAGSPKLAEAATNDQEIVVTARKRSETLAEVPISISAYKGEDLQRRGIDDFTALSRQSPSIQLQDGGVGYRTVYIRGIATETGAAATTGYYFDEVYVEPGGIIRTVIEPNYYDINRVEILRGPQGTIFGGSSMGGTIRIINNQPDLTRIEAKAATEVSTIAHGGISYKGEAALNIPIVKDAVALRLVGSYTKGGGYIDRLVGNFSSTDRTPNGPTTRFNDVDTSNLINVRALLTLKLNDKLTIKPSIYYIENKSANFSSFDVIGTATTGSLEQRRAFNVNEPLTDKTLLANVVVQYDFGTVELTSATSRVDRKASYIEDLSNNLAGGFLNSLAAFGGDQGTQFPSTFLGNNREQSWQQEVRLASTKRGPLQFVVGGFYEDRKRGGPSLLTVQGFQAYYQAKGTGAGRFLASLAPGDDFFSQTTYQRRHQWALFADASYEALPKLKVSAGVRRFHYRIANAVTDISGLINGGTLANPTPPPDAVSAGWSPHFTASYEPNKQLNLFFNAAKGFRPGSANARVSNPVCRPQLDSLGIPVNSSGDIPAYQSDSVWNYEVGVKAKSADRRLAVNQTLYQINWNNVQTSVLLPCGFAFTSNVSSAKVQGSETEVFLNPTERLALTGTLSYTKAVVTETGTGGGLTAANGALVGDQLSNVPKLRFSGTIDYHMPLGDRKSLFSTVNYSYTDSSFRNFDNRPGAARLPTSPPEVVRLRRQQDSYSLVNARVGYEGPWGTVSLFMNNVLDTQPRVFWFSSTFLSPGGYDRQFTIQPRTAGINISKTFR